jgi:hypothetical protein
MLNYPSLTRGAIMAEWLSENAAAIIGAGSALLGAVIAGTVTIASNYFNNRFNKVIRQDQIEFDKWKANRDFYLQKGEELFSSFDKWHDSNSEQSTLYLLRLTSAKTEEEFRNESKHQTIKEFGPKVSSITSLFFNDLNGDFRQLQSICGQISIAYAMAVTEDYTISESMIEITQKIELLRVGSDSFREKIARAVNEKL